MLIFSLNHTKWKNIRAEWFQRDSPERHFLSILLICLFYLKNCRLLDHLHGIFAFLFVCFLITKLLTEIRMGWTKTNINSLILHISQNCVWWMKEKLFRQILTLREQVQWWCGRQKLLSSRNKKDLCFVIFLDLTFFFLNLIL